MLNKDDLDELIKACLKKNEHAQRKLFSLMYQFTMSVASRYGQNQMETEEIANNALYKMLDKLRQYQKGSEFKAWLRKVIIHCGIDYYRKYHKNKARSIDINHGTIRNTGSDRLEQDYLLDMIRRLSPKYKMVFNLFVMEGYSHEEISKELDISVGTSKSNLSKARKKLQSWVIAHQNQMTKYGK